jgi:hypothetical protein
MDTPVQDAGPGPGQYTLPDMVLGQGPAFTIGARASAQQGNSNAASIPGPGAYAAARCGPCAG